MKAVEAGDIDLADEIYRTAGKVCKRKGNFRKKLQKAQARGQALDIVLQGPDANGIGRPEDTLLHWAVFVKHALSVDIFLKHSAFLHETIQNGTPLLGTAIENGDKATAKLLRKAIADRDRRPSMRSLISKVRKISNFLSRKRHGTDGE